MLTVGKEYESNIVPSAPIKDPKNYGLPELWLIAHQLPGGNFLGLRTRYYPEDKFPTWVEFAPDGKCNNQNKNRYLITKKKAQKAGYTVRRGPGAFEERGIGCCGTIFNTAEEAKAWCDKLNTMGPLQWQVAAVAWEEEVDV